MGLCSSSVRFRSCECSGAWCSEYLQILQVLRLHGATVIKPVGHFQLIVLWLQQPATRTFSANIRFSPENNRFHQDSLSVLFVFNTNYSYRQLLSTRTFMYIHSRLTRPIVCRQFVFTKASHTYYCFQTELVEVQHHHSVATLLKY